MIAAAGPPDVTVLLERLRAGHTPREDLPHDTPAAILAALAWTVHGRPVSTRAALALPLPGLTPGERFRLAALVDRCLRGEPAAYLTGRQHFMGLEMRCAPGALIPRPETELLARLAVERLTALLAATGPADPPVVVVDLCTGSGNVAAALAHGIAVHGIAAPGVAGHGVPAHGRAAALPAGDRHARCRITGTDCSAEALALARDNLALLGLSDRVALRAGDLFEALAGTADSGRIRLLTCNPPYLSDAARARLPAGIGTHEPAAALDGGPLGVRILQRLLREAPEHLAPGGRLLTEVGQGQGPGFLRRLEADPRWRSARGHADAGGHVRVIEAVRG